MNCFFQNALAKYSLVGRKAIKFLTQAVPGEHGAGATHLRLAKNKSKNRNVQINGPDAQDAPRVGGDQTLHTLEDFRRVILLALAVEGELGIQRIRKNLAGDAKNFFHGRTKILKQSVLHAPDRQQLQRLHLSVVSSRFSVLSADLKTENWELRTAFIGLQPERGSSRTFKF